MRLKENTEQILPLNENLNYSVWSYLVRFVGIIIFTLLCFWIFGNRSNPISSFIWSSATFLLITVYSSIVLFKNTKWVWFFVIAYLIKLSIGLIHYLYFIDGGYFTSGVYRPMHHEYEAVYNQISAFASDKRNFGIFYFRYSFGGVTHQQILSLISIPFVFFGDYVLTITPINAFSSLLTSMNLILIAKYKFHYDNKVIKIIAIITAYFPLTLISSLLYRDVVGTALMSVGLTLVLLSKKPMIKFIMLLLASYLFFLQRTIYPVVLLLAFTINSLVSQNYKSPKLEMVYKLSSLILGLVLLYVAFPIVLTEANLIMATEGLEVNPFLIPIKFIIGLIGPFPWTQFTLYDKIPANAYQLQDYLQGVLNIAMVITFFVYRKRYFQKGWMNLLNITGILLIVTGLATIYMHTGYVAIGLLFLTPMLCTQINFGAFKKRYLYVFLSMIFLNLIVVAFFGELGISALWR